MQWTAISAGVLATVAWAAPALAVESPPQTAPSASWVVARENPTTVSGLLTRLDRDSRFAEAEARAYGAAGDWTAYALSRDHASPWVASSRDVWFASEGFEDRVRLRTEGPLRRADGSPLPP